MKQILNYVCALIAILLMSSCSQSGNDAYTLKMKLDKGARFTQNGQMDMDMNISAMGMNQAMKMKMDMGTTFEVLENKDNAQLLRMTYDKMQMKMETGMPGAAASLDSVMNENEKKMVGKSVTLKINGNQVTEVDMQGLMQDGEDSVDQAAMRKMFSKENINSMFGIMFNLYPKNPVKVGEKWSADNSIDLNGMAMMIKTTYTLKAVKDSVAEVEVDGTLDTKGIMKQGGVNMDMDMNGTQKGTLYVPLATGYLQKGNYVMDIKAQMNMMGQKIPMDMKMTYAISGGAAK